MTSAVNDRMFGVIARVLVLLTLPALVVSAVLLIAVVTPMTGLSTTASYLLFALGLFLPVLCTLGPARASLARAQGRELAGWMWLASPVICLGAIGLIVELSRA